MVPAEDDRLLPDNNAALAQNTWLYSGALQGMRTPTLLYTGSSSAVKSVFRIPLSYPDKTHIPASYWMEFLDPDVNVIKSPLINDQYARIYWAGASTSPQYNTTARITAGLSAYTLGVTAPTVAPGVTATTTGTTEVRAYVYTWVTTFGEEGPPSPPTVFTGTVSATWSITLTAPGTSDTTGRTLATTRIYRTVTGSNGVATYFFVDEIPIATLSYSDSISDTTVSGNNQLASTGYTPPPSGLQGLISMPNGMIAGWRGSDIWFCEPYHPHAWPAAYTVSVDFPIVGMGLYNQTVVVCTSGNPYSVTGSSPDMMSLSKINSGEPCLSRGSIVSGQLGVYYASPNGITEIGIYGTRTVTAKMITKDKWNDNLTVGSLRAAKLAQAYYCWGSPRLGSFEPTAFNTSAFEQGDYTGSYNGALIDINDPRVSWTNLVATTPVFNVITDLWTGEIFIMQNGNVYWIDVSNSRSAQNYIWKSKIFKAHLLKNFEAARVWFAQPTSTPNLTLKVYADGRLVLTRPVLTSGGMIRLPSGFKAEYWQFELDGSEQVFALEVATSAKELANV